MVEHYFNQENPEPLMFKLVESPSTTEHEIIPYMNRRGNPSICFVAIEKESAKSSPDEL
jgi:hypothetical protein